MYCFGVSNHSPESVIDFLKQRKYIKDDSGVAIVPVGTMLKLKKPARPFVFIINIEDFYRNREVLNSKEYGNAKVFIFASALRVRELRHCTALDSEPSRESDGLIIRLKRKLDPAAYALAEPVNDVKRMDTKFLSSMIETVKRGSLLSPLMTFIFTLPSSTHQTPIKELCAAYFFDGINYQKHTERVGRLRDITVSARVMARMKEILTSDIAANYQAFFKEYRSIKDGGKTPNVESLCKRHKTAVYEVRYLLSIVEEKNTRGKLRGKTIIELNNEDQESRKHKKAAEAKAAKEAKNKPAEKSDVKAKAKDAKKADKAKAKLKTKGKLKKDKKSKAEKLKGKSKNKPIKKSKKSKKGRSKK